MSDRIVINLNRTIKELTETSDEYKILFDANPRPWSSEIKIEFESLLQLLKQNQDFILESLDKWEDALRKIKDLDQRQAEFEIFDKWRDDDTNRGKYLLQENNNDASNISTKNDITTTSETWVTATVPQLNLPKFDGSYLKWNPFWQRFQHAVHSKPYPKIEKLISLLGFLEGRALEEVEGFAVSEENYDTIVDTLINRFGKKSLVVIELQSKLRSIEKATSHPESLRTTVNMLCNLCRQLQNLGVDVDNYSTKIDVIEKLPDNEMNKLKWLLISDPDNATIEKLMDKMKEMALKAELASKYCAKFDSKPSNNVQPSTNSPNFNSKNIPTDTGGKFKCSLCDEPHNASICPNYVSPEEKLTQLRARSYCTKCGYRNHDTNNCLRKLECRKCDGTHADFLCKNASKNTTAFVSVEKKQGMLLTKEITVINPVTKETTETVVIFDTGSQQSYVSNQLIRQLKLQTLQKEKLNVTGFGAKASDYISSLVELQIKTDDGHMNIHTNSTKKIAATVPVAHAESFELNDIQTIYKPAHVLIGMDYFFKFITSFEEFDENLHVVHSRVGKMLCKNIPEYCKTTVSSMAIKSSQCLHKAEHGLLRNHESCMKTTEEPKETNVIEKCDVKTDTAFTCNEEQNALNVNEKHRTDKSICPKFRSFIHRAMKVKTGTDFTCNLERSRVTNVIGDVQEHAEILSNQGSAVQKEFQRQNKFVRPPSSLTTGTDVTDEFVQHDKPLLQKFQYLSPQQQSEYLALCGKPTTVCGGEGLAEHSKKSHMNTMNIKQVVTSDTDILKKEYTKQSTKNKRNNDLNKIVRDEKDSDDRASHTYLISFDYSSCRGECREECSRFSIIELCNIHHSSKRL